MFFTTRDLRLFAEPAPKDKIYNRYAVAESVKSAKIQSLRDEDGCLEGALTGAFCSGGLSSDSDDEDSSLESCLASAFGVSLWAVDLSRPVVSSFIPSRLASEMGMKLKQETDIRQVNFLITSYAASMTIQMSRSWKLSRLSSAH